MLHDVWCTFHPALPQFAPSVQRPHATQAAASCCAVRCGVARLSAYCGYTQIALFKDHMELLQMVAHKRGKLKKGGLPDLAGAAREILGDWCRPNHPVRDTIVVRDTMSCGIPCRAGYHVVRDTMSCGIPCRAGHWVPWVVHRAVSRLGHALCAACCMLHFVCCILHVA